MVPRNNNINNSEQPSGYQGSSWEKQAYQVPGTQGIGDHSQTTILKPSTSTDLFSEQEHNLDEFFTSWRDLLAITGEHSK